MGQDVFISYARGASQPAARRLRADLTSAGFSVFLDEREIPFGAAFPGELVRGLLDARVVVVFAEESYFKRPWCVHELRLLTAAWRSGDESGLSSVVVALPTGAGLEAVTAQLPPPLASASWPNAGQAGELAALVSAALETSTSTLRQRLAYLNDDTTRVMLEGADQPLAWSTTPVEPAAPAPALWLIDDAPSPRGEGFIGRAAAVWQLVHECITARAFTPARRVLVQGLGGSGKSLLAAEFVARHARRFFPAGVVWINAGAGADELARIYAALWRHLMPGSPPPDDAAQDARTRLQQLAPQLGKALEERVGAGTLLWVIDGLPEPGGGAPGGIADWCPAPRHVSVLATTRRADSLREIDAVVRLGPLAENAGLTLLTRPPVEAGWMTDVEWRAVVHWVGGLPLVLAVLRESLLDGSLAIDDLRRAPEAEPAAESERLMEGLRGEVDDHSLRGAAEAFELSWRALAGDPALAGAACRLALLAPVALTEPLLAAVAGTAQVGKLVRRGWLQPGGVAATRTFILHRVPASVLRMKADPPDAAFASVFDGLAHCTGLDAGEWSRARVELHTDAVIRRFQRLTQRPAQASLSAAARLAMAAAEVAPDERRGFRFLAAGLAGTSGAGDAFVAALRSKLDSGDERSIAALPHVLQALPHCDSAAGWMAELLAHPSDLVRQQTMVHAPGVPALLRPLLLAILAEPETDRSPDNEICFDRFLEPAFLRTALSELLHARAEGNALVRRRVAFILGRALMIHGREFKAGGYSGAHMVRHLLQVAFNDEDEQVREAAATAAANGGNPVDDTAWSLLCQSVEERSGPDQVSALKSVGWYLIQARKPPPPRDINLKRDDEGRITLSLDLPSGTNWPAGVVPKLVDWVLTLPAEASLQAARVLMSDNQGMHDMAQWVHAKLDSRDFEPVRGLGDALCEVRPEFVNGPWWRGQARAALGAAADACSDFEAVLKLKPDFEPAQAELANASVKIGNAAFDAGDWDSALAWAGRASAAQPNVPDSHHLAACVYFNTGRFAAAEASASRVIELLPGFAAAWWVRAMARANLGRPDEALVDARQAVQLDPADQRFAQVLHELDPASKSTGDG